MFYGDVERHACVIVPRFVSLSLRNSMQQTATVANVIEDTYLSEQRELIATSLRVEAQSDSALLARHVAAHDVVIAIPNVNTVKRANTRRAPIKGISFGLSGERDVSFRRVRASFNDVLEDDGNGRRTKRWHLFSHRVESNTGRRDERGMQNVAASISYRGAVCCASRVTHRECDTRGFQAT